MIKRFDLEEIVRTKAHDIDAATDAISELIESTYDSEIEDLKAEIEDQEILLDTIRDERDRLDDQVTTLQEALELLARKDKS